MTDSELMGHAMEICSLADAMRPVGAATDELVRAYEKAMSRSQLEQRRRAIAEWPELAEVLMAVGILYQESGRLAERVEVLLKKGT